MATDTAKLLLEIDASVELLRRNLSRAEARVDQFGNTTDRALDRVDRRFDQAGRGALGVGRHLDFARSRVDLFANSVKAGAAGLAAGFTVDTVVRLASAGLDYASSLGEQAQQLGVTTDTLQEYRYAASQLGITQEQIDTGLQKLTRTLGEAAAGAKKPSKAFAQLGIDIFDANGRIKEAGDIIPEIAEALSKIEDPARRARLEVALFGRNGQNLDTLLAGGAGAINNLRDAAHDLGIVLSEDQIQNADDAADKLGAVKTVLEAQIAGVVADNAQSIIELADALAELASWAITALNAYRRFKESTVGAAIIRTLNPVGTAGGMIVDGLNALGGGSNSSPSNNRSGGSTPNVTLADVEGGAGRSGGSRAGRSGRSPADIAREAARNAARFEDDLGSARVALLRSVAQLTGAASAQYAAEMAQIAEDRAAFDRQLALDEDLTAARRAALTQERDRLDVNNRAIAEQALFNSEQEQMLALLQDRLGREREAVEDQLSLADSATRRLELENRLIDLAQREERAVLERILATERTSSAEYEIAQARLAELNDVRRRAESQARRENETPLQQYLRELNRSSEAINEDLEQIAVDGLDSLNDGLVDAIMNAENLGDVFSNVAEQIIADLLRIAIQQAIIQPLANNLLGGSGKGGGFNLGGFVSSLFGGKRATGGPVRAGMFYEVGEAGKEIFVPKVDGDILSNATINRRGSGGAGGVTLAMTINAPGATAETVAMIRRELASAAPQIIKAARDVTLRSASRGRLP